MDKDWRTRLAEVIAADSRSLREISLAAKKGPNYVQQLLKDEKDPSFPNLASLLAVLGTSATLYVVLNLRLSPEAEQIFRTILRMTPEHQRELVDSLDALRSGASQPTPSPGPRR